MLSKISVFVAVALAAVTVAGYPHGYEPEPQQKYPSTEQCGTGNVQCCNSIQPAGSPNIPQSPDDLLGLYLQGLGVPIGLQCDTVTVIGLASGAKCNQQAACCHDNDEKSLVGINCTPINLAV